MLFMNIKCLFFQNVIDFIIRIDSASRPSLNYLFIANVDHYYCFISISLLIDEQL